MNAAIPQTELHRHLDVSVRASTLLELAQAKGLEAQSTSLQAFKKKFMLREQLQDLAEALAKFTLFQHVLDRPEILERAAFEAAEDCWREGTQWIEFRFAPSFVCEKSGLSWDTALHAFASGLQKAETRYPGLKAGLICIAARDYGIDEAAKTTEFYLKNQDRFIGVDLAGNEGHFPSRTFEPAFKAVIKHFQSQGKPAPITIHAGEAAGPESIWEALELLGARRIGHGVRCIEDVSLMDWLRDHGICLEICPTSNWITNTVENLAKHPVARIVRHGIPATINTDDPGIFDCTLPGEYTICLQTVKLTHEELQACKKTAYQSSFMYNC